MSKPTSTCSSEYEFISSRINLAFTIERRARQDIPLDSLKALAAHSIAARVTSEESLTKLELPRSLFQDLKVAHKDLWKRDVDLALQWVTHMDNFEMNALTLTDFAKFFFPDLPLQRIREVLRDNFPYAFHETNLCLEAPCFYDTQESCGMKVSLVFLNDLKALLPKMKKILCTMTNHMVISCQSCEDPSSWTTGSCTPTLC